MPSCFLFNAMVSLADQVLGSKNIPADKIFQNFCKEYKIGSKNRRDLSFLFFNWLRQYWLGNELAKRVDSPAKATELKISIFLQKVQKNELIPPNIFKKIENTRLLPINARANMALDLWQEFARSFKTEQEAFEESQALLTEAPTDIRVNAFAGFSKSMILRELCSLGIEVEDLPYSPCGMRLHKRVSLLNHPRYKQGAFEIQDLGSQVMVLLCDVQPQMRVLDYCAGAGGKSLAMLNDLKDSGQLVLSDIHEHRLAIAKRRIERIQGFQGFQGFQGSNVAFCLAPQIDGKFDRVVVDAPCSGMGVLRRSPGRVVHLRQADILEFAALQKNILEQASQYVENGGYLAYMTCSLLKAENEEIAAAFLAGHADFITVPIADLWAQKFQKLMPANLYAGLSYLRLSPLTFQTDGFFLAIFQKQT